MFFPREDLPQTRLFPKLATWPRYSSLLGQRPATLSKPFTLLIRNPSCYCRRSFVLFLAPNNDSLQNFKSPRIADVVVLLCGPSNSCAQIGCRPLMENRLGVHFTGECFAPGLLTPFSMRATSQNDISTTKMQNIYLLINILRYFFCNVCWRTLHTHVSAHCTTRLSMYIFCHNLTLATFTEWNQPGCFCRAIYPQHLWGRLVDRDRCIERPCFTRCSSVFKFLGLRQTDWVSQARSSVRRQARWKLLPSNSHLTTRCKLQPGKGDQARFFPLLTYYWLALRCLRAMLWNHRTACLASGFQAACWKSPAGVVKLLVRLVDVGAVVSISADDVYMLPEEMVSYPYQVSLWKDKMQAVACKCDRVCWLMEPLWF